MGFGKQLPLRHLTAIITATAICLTTALSSADGRAVSDAEIAAAVERQFTHDDAVPGRQTEVRVVDGVVTLDGEVETLAARQQAEDIAGIVRGVRSVINRLRLTPTTKTTDVIQQDVETALRVDPVAEPYEIDVHATSNGLIRLVGEVDSWAEREQVEKSIMTVPGVRTIRNELEVSSSVAPRGEGEIGEEIASRLRWDVRVDDSLINVLVLEGSRVVLSGTVGSLAEKRQAERLARVAGVADVYTTQLTVEPWARNDELRRARLGPKPTDAEISAAITTALRYDPRVAVENVSATARDGVAVLSGSVANLLARRAANDDARNTYGVDKVRNELVIDTGGRSDQEIRELIANAFHGNGLAEHNDIAVHVQNGTVRLIGDATSASAHWQAEKIATGVRGVKEVRNELTIDGQMPTMLTRLYAFDPQVDELKTAAKQEVKTDREIHEEIESELFWSPFVDSDEVDIDVDDGVVTLMGEVDSAREYAAASENAFEGGALMVKNELSIVN